jgi:hypothetical protein
MTPARRLVFPVTARDAPVRTPLREYEAERTKSKLISDI